MKTALVTMLIAMTISCCFAYPVQLDLETDHIDGQPDYNYVESSDVSSDEMPAANSWAAVNSWANVASSPNKRTR